MSLQKSVPKNKAIYFNNLQSHTTGSIPVSPTIYTKFKYFINNIHLAVDLKSLLSVLKMLNLYRAILKFRTDSLNDNRIFGNFIAYVQYVRTIFKGLTLTRIS